MNHYYIFFKIEGNSNTYYAHVTASFMQDVPNALLCNLTSYTISRIDAIIAGTGDCVDLLKTLLTRSTHLANI